MDFSMCVMHSFVRGNRSKINAVVLSGAQLSHLFALTFSRIVGSTLTAVTQFVPGFGTALAPAMSMDKSMRHMVLMASQTIRLFRGVKKQRLPDSALETKFDILERALSAVKEKTGSQAVKKP